MAKLISCMDITKNIKDSMMSEINEITTMNECREHKAKERHLSVPKSTRLPHLVTTGLPR
ncbi:hypothetical protein Sjap_009178 [Stephania japonica]|uniref:Uncharacterized protein n=1 Tax=Stephania japonica TaxID=461633 RepID=A0AAP0JRG7_9MAGN